MNMFKKIKVQLKHTKALYNINILFAIESGSRLWGMADEKSDYDIRFVYNYRMSDYLHIDKKQDNITRMFEIDGEIKLDLVGFDIYKYLRLLRNANPNCIEWLLSDIVYYTDKDAVREMLNFARDTSNLWSLAKGYRGIANNSVKDIKKEIQKQYETDDITCVFPIKKLLYALRGMMCGEYILHKQDLPPVKFLNLIKEEFIPKEVRNQTHSLIMNKREGAKIISVGESEVLLNYLADHKEEKDLYKSILDKPREYNGCKEDWLNDIIMAEIV